MPNKKVERKAEFSRTRLRSHMDGGSVRENSALRLPFVFVCLAFHCADQIMAEN